MGSRRHRSPFRESDGTGDCRHRTTAPHGARNRHDAQHSGNRGRLVSHEQAPDALSCLSCPGDACGQRHRGSRLPTRGRHAGHTFGQALDSRRSRCHAGCAHCGPSQGVRSLLASLPRGRLTSNFSYAPHCQQVAGTRQRVGFAPTLFRLSGAVYDSTSVRTRVQSRPGEGAAAPGRIAISMVDGSNPPFALDLHPSVCSLRFMIFPVRQRQRGLCSIWEPTAQISGVSRRYLPLSCTRTSSPRSCSARNGSLAILAVTSAASQLSNRARSSPLAP